MKFSVLLPTRNRLEYLRYAIESVRRQDHPDWEIIVSDNVSEDDIGGYIQGLHDPRIRYVRTEKLLPVTDNWNYALERSSGEYVIMLGDDDCLMKGYFTSMLSTLDAFEDPDFIFTGAYLYAYPNVIPGHPAGLLQQLDYAVYRKQEGRPYWLDRDSALDIVKQTFAFRAVIAYNMQFSLISRRFIDRLAPQGPFFQSPYPDFYATNVMLLRGTRIVVHPAPLVAIGISPKSYGYFYFNQQERTGREFLQNYPVAELDGTPDSLSLFGSDMYTCWLLAMKRIQRNYPEGSALYLDQARYRHLQIRHGLKMAIRPDGADRTALDNLYAAMTWGEKLCYAWWMHLAYFAETRRRNHPLRFLARSVRYALQVLPWRKDMATVRKLAGGGYANILEVFERGAPEPADRQPAGHARQPEPAPAVREGRG